MQRDRKPADVNGDELFAHAAIAHIASGPPSPRVAGFTGSMSMSSALRNASRSGSINEPAGSGRTSHHTVLPSGNVDVPHAAASEPTSPRARPVGASRP